MPSSNSLGLPKSLYDSILSAASALRSGHLVAFPTETVYGLGADATNPEAVLKLFTLKHRPSFNPLIVHVASREMISQVVSEVPPLAQRLIEAFFPGPLTLVLPKAPTIADIVTAGLPTVGLRIPNHPIAHLFLTQCHCPVAAPSANLFTQLSSTTAQAVRDQFPSSLLEHLIEGGETPLGVESTVIGFSKNTPQLLRYGACPVEAIESVLSLSLLPPPSFEIPHSGITPVLPSPGLLKKHYAPRTPLVLYPRETPFPRAYDIGVLAFGPAVFSQTNPSIPCGPVIQLSETENLTEAASRFFSSLHALDRMGLRYIVSKPFPATGLGFALNDKLERAKTQLPPSVVEEKSQ